MERPGKKGEIQARASTEKQLDVFQLTKNLKGPQRMELGKQKKLKNLKERVRSHANRNGERLGKDWVGKEEAGRKAQQLPIILLWRLGKRKEGRINVEIHKKAML